MNSKAAKLESELKSLADSKRAELSQRYFKTGPGEYGEGDVFLGISVPVQRTIARKYYDLELSDLKGLLRNSIHEFRLTSLFILGHIYKKSEHKRKKSIINFYLSNRKYINNWDLVDSSAPYILGDYLIDKPKKILLDLAKSENIWDRRIAVLATFAFITNNEFSWTIKLAKLLLKDKHDLMHKAVGWMLRETGKRDFKVLKNFLDKYAGSMPRTMLRYAVEKIPEERRKYYMKK
jgi:3-methyladenine DNA glycosylase AlkD